MMSNEPNKYCIDDVTKMILGFVRKNLSEKNHMQKVGSLEYQTTEIWAFEIQISPY